MSKSKSKIESIILALLLIIGLVGVFSVISDKEDVLSSPDHALEHPAESFQISMEEGISSVGEVYVFD
jgi:hypothetical protein